LLSRSMGYLMDSKLSFKKSYDIVVFKQFKN
jgi:hypothetical protein